MAEPRKPNPITAIVIDDSAVVRKHLSDTLTAGGIEVFALPIPESLKGPLQ